MLPAQPQQDAAHVAKELLADARVAESLQIVAELPPDDLIEQAARTLIRTAVHQAVKRKKVQERCSDAPLFPCGCDVFGQLHLTCFRLLIGNLSDRPAALLRSHTGIFAGIR